MKRTVALLLCLMMACTVISSFPASVFAEDKADFETPLWQPVEIPLKSTVKYGNPYLSAQIDVTFTHEDGTAITTPGLRGFRLGSALFAHERGLVDVRRHLLG